MLIEFRVGSISTIHCHLIKFFGTEKTAQGLTHLEVHSPLFFDNGSLLQFFFGVHLPGFFGLCVNLWQWLDEWAREQSHWLTAWRRNPVSKHTGCYSSAPLPATARWVIFLLLPWWPRCGSAQPMPPRGWSRQSTARNISCWAPWRISVGTTQPAQPWRRAHQCPSANLASKLLFWVQQVVSLQPQFFNSKMGTPTIVVKA